MLFVGAVVDDRVLGNPCRLVLVQLVHPVALHALVGDDLDHEIGRPDDARGGDAIEVGSGDEEQVGLPRGAIGPELHLDGGGEEIAETIDLNEEPDDLIEKGNQASMIWFRWYLDKDLPIDPLGPHILVAPGKVLLVAHLAPLGHRLGRGEALHWGHGIPPHFNHRPSF